MSDKEMCDRLIDEILAIYKRIDKGEIEEEDEARTEIRKAISKAIKEKTNG